MRYALLLPLAAALLAVATPAAGAATVSATITHNFDPGLPAKGVPPTVSTSASVRVNAPSGELNTMTLRPAGTDVVEVEDTTTPERAGAGCTQQSPTVVRCAVGGPLTVNATLGDKDDAWESGAVKATVNGGAGTDRLHAAGRLVGGDGDDTLTAIDASAVTGGPTVLDGGAGADHMTGGVVSYVARTAPVSVDLHDPGTDGAPGEGDVIAAAQGAIGGAGDDTLLGTDGADVLYGGPGSDRIDGRGGDDVVDGGRAPGNVPAGNVADGVQPTASTPEQVEGGPGNDRVGGAGTLDGGDGDDRIAGDGSLAGGAGDDALRGIGPGAVLDGGPGNDSVAEDASASPAAATVGSGPIVLRGGPGDDAVGPGGSGDVPALLDGGDGNDTLWALARGDVAPGPGVDQVGDRLDGGAGNDTFRTRDGEVDRITCGDGEDRALLDQVDVITDATAANPNGSCERVVRKAPKPHESATEDAQQSPQAPTA